MFNASEVNQELVRAFNINLRFNGIAVTNFTVQNLYGKDHIIISFDKNMGSKQCMDYLNDLKEKIIKKSYKNKEAAGVSYNLQFFPFAFNTKHLPRDDKGKKRFSVEIDEGVVFNLKCYLAQALAGDVIVKMGSKFTVERIKKSIYDTSFDRNSYLYCMLFHDKGLQKDFVDSFLANIEGYENAPRDYLEIIGNCVYIKKSIFDNVEFIKDIIAYNTSLECRYLQAPSAENKTVDKLKYTMIDFIDRAADIPVRTITRTSYVDSKEDSVLIPLVQNGKFLGFLSKGDAYDLNRTFGDTVVTRIESRRLKNPYWSSNYVYAIDFADVDIACCVLNKIIESSVINKDHELSIDPELRFQALSPAQSPVRVPNGPSSYFTESLSPTQEFPSRSQSGPLKESARRGSGREEETGGLFRVLPGEIDQTSACTQGRWSSQSTSGNKWASSTQFTQPGPSGLSWKGAAQNVQASTNLWTQQPNPWSLQSSNLKEDCEKICEDFEEAYEKIVSDSSLSKEEQELFKELLYWFNLNNYALDPPHTNFIVKNGKIASLIDDSVNVREYLREVIDKTKEEYCVNKKEAYDLNEFPFKFLSNCEKNQEITVVANISSGVLSNLKKLFIQKHEKEVKIEDIDINIIEKAVKSKKDEWVNSQVQRKREKGVYYERVRPCEAITTCYPDESVLEYISITKDKGGYWIDRGYDGSEVKSFKGERWPAKGTSKAGKTKPEGQDSGIGSSGDTTDAEKVNPNDEPMDYQASSHVQQQNPWSDDEGSSSESLRSDSSPKKRKFSLSSESSNSLSEEEVGSPCSSFSDSGSEQLCKKFCGANLGRK